MVGDAYIGNIYMKPPASIKFDKYVKIFEIWFG